MKVILPQVELSANLYLPDRSITPIDPEITEHEELAMRLALILGEEALHDGNPPVGAYLLDGNSGFDWGAKTIDKTDRNLMGHAEMRLIDAATPIVGDDLSNCTLVTTAQPCSSCTPLLAEGKIAKIIYAAPRCEIYPLTGIMRPREFNLPQLLSDGLTTTVVIEGLFAAHSLANFAQWGEMRAEGLVRA